MNQFLRSLTPTQQVATLFLIVFGILVAVSLAAFLLSFRAEEHDAPWQAELKNFRKLLGTSWFMVVVFWVAWALGDTVDDLVALRPRLDRIEPDACRERIERFFTYRVMTEGYLRMFRGFLATGVLPDGVSLAGTGAD